MSIPARFLDEIRDRLTLSEVIGRRLKLTRAGREYKACCPFHHEKSPSFYVNDDKQFYHCFGCGAHGDVIGFVMQNDNLSFIETVEMLAAEAGLQVPKASPQAVEQAKKEKSLYALMDDAARFFEAQLHEGKGRDARSYLDERAVPDDLRAAFRLGYAPEDGQAILRHLKEKGYETRQIIEAGVARASERGGEAYSFFRDRVIFPVADRRGRIVAFGGRVLPEHLRPLPDGAGKPPKYINSSETALFHKGTLLYGESHARQAATDGQPVIVVEGYLDVMACFGAGFRGAVAPLGTALTEEQIGSLWKMIPAEEKTPILCFDGDDAGRRAAWRACSRLLPMLKPYHSARIAFLPKGQDPDSLIKSQGRKVFEGILSGAMPLADMVWLHHTAGRRFDTPEARAGLSAVLDSEVALIPDRNVQQYYRRMFRDRLFRAFGPQKQGKGAAQGLGGDPAILPRRPGGEADALACLILTATLLNHPHIFDSVEESFAQLDLSDRRLNLLRQEILAALAAESSLDSAALHSHLKQRGFEEELRVVTAPSVYIHAGFARPDASAEAVLAGWQDIVRHMSGRSDRIEIHQAGRLLAADPTEENMKRLLSLRRAREAE